MLPEDIIIEIKKFAAKGASAACDNYDINDTDYSCGYFHGMYIAFGQVVDFICQIENLSKK